MTDRGTSMRGTHVTTGTNALKQDLERSIAGEVRFDAVSRALYSTDASVYQIEPLGVVVPRTRDDMVQAVKIALRHGVSITARGVPAGGGKVCRRVRGVARDAFHCGRDPATAVSYG